MPLSKEDALIIAERVETVWFAIQAVLRLLVQTKEISHDQIVRHLRYAARNAEYPGTRELLEELAAKIRVADPEAPPEN